MTNDLALNLPQDIIQQLKQSTQGPPFIAIAQSSSDIVKKEDKCKAGDIFLWQGKEPIGTPIPDGMQRRPPVRQELKILVGHFRPVACRMVNQAVQARSYNWNDPIFQQIKSEAMNKIEGSMVGFEHLVKVLPSRSDGNDIFLGWATISFTKSAAQAAPVSEGVGNIYMFRSQLVETKKFSWWTPNLTRTIEPTVNLQEEEGYTELLQTFMEPTTLVDEGIER